MAPMLWYRIAWFCAPPIFLNILSDFSYPWRVPVKSERKLDPGQVVQGLRLAAAVADVTVQRQRPAQLLLRIGITAEPPGRDPGMAQGRGHAADVRGALVQGPRLVVIGESLTGPPRPLVGHAGLVESVRFAPPVSQRAVDRGCVLGQGQRHLITAGLLAHLAEFHGRPRDPGRIIQVAAGLQGHGVGGDRLGPERPDVHEPGQRVGQVGALVFPFVLRRVLRGLEDVAPLRFQPAGRVFPGAQRRARGRRVSSRPGCALPEGVQDLVGVGRAVQVVVQQPADGLPPLGPGVLLRGARGRVAADQIVEPVLPGRGPRQQVLVKERGEGLLRIGEGAAASAAAAPG